MVPVGGSVIYSHQKKGLVEKINKFYPGRASSGPIIDLFLTLLEMGQTNLRTLLKERKDNFEYLKTSLTALLATYNERVLDVKTNKISLACTLTTLNTKIFAPNGIPPTFIGSYLFSRRV